MALHQAIQRVLLIGVHLEPLARTPTPSPPAALTPLIEAIAPCHRAFDERAIDYGHRYRSGFWAIYLLSAIAVLFAVLPLALGWDSPGHRLHSYAALWASGEVLVIGTVFAIYWWGHSGRWHGWWLEARTTAELTWYLPMLAPLLDLTTPAAEANWYLRVFDPGQPVRAADDEVAAQCARSEPLARKLLVNAWSDPEFIAGYARWTIEILEQQRHYHRCVATRQHALLHRVHQVTTGLFGLTGLGALLHLAVHSIWLSVITTFFPALGASLHGAIAQSEAHRLGTTSEGLVGRLEGAIDRVRAATRASASGGEVAPLKVSIRHAIALILEEHKDWYLLVQPHRLHLA
ncbi:MAG: hypothetical protein E6K20_01155 [Gammaproteobacteria bacterium]|nr:MAG: hypothetical protein E6K20_01155 [Gammaproteobacteria bacterium]